MVRQPFDLLGHPVPGERLQGLDDAGMEHPPPLLQQAAVGHLVGQGVLEGVFALGKEPGLVEELGACKVRQATLEHRLGHVGNGLQQRQGHLRANHGRRLQQALLLGGKPVDTRRQHRPARWPAPGWSAGPAPGDRPHARRPGPRSPPGCARSLPGKKGLPSVRAMSRW